MSEDEIPYGLPSDVWEQLQSPNAPSVSQGASYGRCEAPCCNQVEPYWSSRTAHLDTLDIERYQLWRQTPDGQETARWEDHVSRRHDAWLALHGREPRTTYGPVVAAYWAGYETWTLAYDRAYWKEIASAD